MGSATQRGMGGNDVEGDGGQKIDPAPIVETFADEPSAEALESAKAPPDQGVIREPRQAGPALPELGEHVFLRTAHDPYGDAGTADAQVSSEENVRATFGPFPGVVVKVREASYFVDVRVEEADKPSWTAYVVGFGASHAGAYWERTDDDGQK